MVSPKKPVYNTKVLKVDESVASGPPDAASDPPDAASDLRETEPALEIDLDEHRDCPKGASASTASLKDQILCK